MPNILGVELDTKNPRVEVILRPQTKKDREKAIKKCSVKRKVTSYKDDLRHVK